MNVQMVLETTAIMGHFSAIIAGEDVSNGKPAPDTFFGCC